jgi:hypothetical protein
MSSQVPKNFLPEQLSLNDDLDFVDKEVYCVLTDIVSWHVGGTRFAIKVDSDGLLNSGEPGVQLTWMDAKMGDLIGWLRRGTGSLLKFRPSGTTHCALCKT